MLPVRLEVNRPEVAIDGDNGDMNLFKYSGGLPCDMLVHHLVPGAHGNGGRREGHDISDFRSELSIFLLIDLGHILTVI